MFVVKNVADNTKEKITMVKFIQNKRCVTPTVYITPTKCIN